MNTGLIRRVHRNQIAGAYLSLYFFISYFLEFPDIKNLRHIFSGTVSPTKLKLGLIMVSGLLYRANLNQAA